MPERIIKLLESSVARREPLKNITDAVRLVNGRGDGLEGLVLEQYNRRFAAQVFDKRWLKEKDLLTGFLKDRLDAQYLIVKDRTESASSAPEGFKTQVWIEEAGSETIVRENGLKFSVELSRTLNNGLFLDMRRNRKIISGVARGKKVLNCFAYSCSFGVYCRAHGASSVINVDISKKYLERGRVNYSLNRLIPEKSEFIPQDALRYLERAVKRGNCFGLIVLDPPSFSRNEGKVFSVKKDMARLIELAIRILEPRGILFTSTNFSGITCDDIFGMILKGAGRHKIKERKFLGQDIDFPEAKESYLAAVLAEL